MFVCRYNSLTNSALHVYYYHWYSYQASSAVDVYALGVVMWEVYMEQRPWSQEHTVNDIFAQVTCGTQLAFNTLAKSPEALDKTYREIAAACMRSDPAKRPPLSEVVQALSSESGI